LLTLTGPGGTGKSRLALALAGDLLDAFGGEVCWVDLGPVDSPARVLSTIARTLGVHETGGLPPGRGLQRALRERTLLLVLDNFEHVLPAAGDLAVLLEGCSRIKLLVTSREPLRLRWEREVPVAPLGLPEPDQSHDPVLAARAGAVALFVERARDREPHFELGVQNVAAVSALCRRLDGLPLAIELAAARLPVLPPLALLARLGERLDLLRRDGPDTPARHRTLTAAVAWSYGLLSAPEQALFRRLGVFAGGATLEALETVAESGPDLVEQLSALADKSLIQVQRRDPAPRFRLLETVRAFALEVLATDAEEPAVRRRHAEYFLGLAERAELGILGSEQENWFAELEPELNNFRAALRWAIDLPEPELALRLGSALMAFWFPRGHFLEARAWLTEALGLGGVASTAPARIKSLARLGALLALQGDGRAGARLTAEALELARQLGDRLILGQVAQGVGLAALARGEWAGARAAFDDARTCMRAVGNWFWEAFAEDYLGVVAAHEGSITEAAGLVGEALARRRAGGDRWGEAESLERLGLLSLRQGSVAEAHARLSTSLRVRCELGDKLGLARGLEALAAVAARADQVERAARLLGAADSVRDSLGAIILPPEQAEHERTVALATHGLGDDAFRAAWALGRDLSVVLALQLATAPLEVPPHANPDVELMTDGLGQSECEAPTMASGGTAPTLPPLGALLQRHRHAVGLSQMELAERAGLSQRGISDLERNLRQAPYPATIRRLAEALALSEADRATLLTASRRGT
jgi:non-specific serine/threonine protein kinase